MDEEAPVLKPGDPAPAFTTRDHEGKEVRLEALKGQRVILWFYPKADTPGCTLEGCGFRDQHEAIAKKGARVLGMSYDTPEENAAFAKKYRLGYPLLSDTDKAIAKAYGAYDPQDEGYPRRHTFVIGADGRLEHVLLDVKPKFHAQQILGLLPT